MIEELISQNKRLFLNLDVIFIVKAVLFGITSIVNIIKDLKERTVTSSIFIILTIFSLLCQLFFIRNTFFLSFIAVLLILIIFSIIFILSKGGIGFGDMFYLGFFASMFGYFITIFAFLFSFWIATIVLIIPYLLRKIDKKTKIPFIPFIFAGCTGAILLLS